MHVMNAVKAITMWLALVGVKTELSAWMDEQQFGGLLIVGATENELI